MTTPLWVAVLNVLLFKHKAQRFLYPTIALTIAAAAMVSWCACAWLGSICRASYPGAVAQPAAARRHTFCKGLPWMMPGLS
jgi:hypothetical protein